MNKLKELWNKYNPFDIHSIIKNISANVKDIHISIQKIDVRLQNEIDGLEKSLLFNQTLITAISDAVPDMIWLKDLNGNYLYANNAIRSGLLFSANPIGKNDIELSKKAKKYYGNSNHTFGEVCGNSDKVIIKTLKPQRFLESGKIKGEEFYLEVFKAPFFIDDELVGVCGVGRDLTHYVQAYRDSHCSKCELTDRNDLFSKFEFKGEETDGRV